MMPEQPNLLYPKIAAWLLAAYAAFYTFLMLVFMGAGITRDPEMVLFVGAMLALALTPFLALVYLPRLRDGTLGRMDIGMTLIMACPTAFWGWLLWDEIGRPINQNLTEVAVITGLLGLPAFLSAFLCLTFASAVVRRLRA